MRQFDTARQAFRAALDAGPHEASTYANLGLLDLESATGTRRSDTLSKRSFLIRNRSWRSPTCRWRSSRHAGDEANSLEHGMLQVMIRFCLKRVREQQDFRLTEQLARELHSRRGTVEESAWQADDGMAGAIR